MDCAEYYAKVKLVLTQFLAKPKPISPNITKKERITLQDLRKGDSGMVLAADEGGALVIMDKDMYIEKYMVLLNDEEVQKDAETRSSLSTL